MQLTTLLSTSAMVATTYALRTAVTLNAIADASKPYVRVINRCPYDVHLWSVFKGDGCPTDGMVTLKTGGTYTENYADKAADLGDGDNHTGISIKISKTEECKGNDITQLEYFQEFTGALDFQMNYFDVSYVDCLGGDCPARNDGYYINVGDQQGKNKASSDGKWCPCHGCHDQASCDAISYVLPDDVRTLTCNHFQNIDFYMCGGNPPSDEDDSPAPPKSSSSPAPKPSKAKPTSTPVPSSSSPTPEVYAADATPSSSPSPSPTSEPPTTTPAPTSEPPKITKTEFVYVTAYEYVNAKRHAHDHARRHQQFHA
ncbi:hypothetical protein PtrSN002B_005344 [Pyrenophora tritici-repentis]|uniref:DUF605 multi-domain protein n=2 Tax=Pyrenophora tritici-repentis TaxID=45151 RepID=A0A2W1EAE5_9PLEO|nr:uncharacterized protein PTRG_03084 [Pyrenophora tritici-repentis Pt-1C-BFP]KAA8622834.1 hypothetical protein PtrV1_04140 [Pyrenophora tritici-repentis]EDU45607.1 conserved hypothetical protein [Pyrenophora tritici-repentis Pt-1C-BFP]KAF7451823.1 hypothetical protein A1F99_036000 [Pyrenophora tritici-repentis]KAF7575054.1 DUF605 multi-domain protein [Pyrenophora tritici-repentis]KAG9386184.1 hypothetical protein A1F94_002934 [Pyrenophora tritici-repentis]